MKNQHKNKKRLLKTLVGGAIGLALLGGTYITISNNKNYLRPENFNKAEWIEFHNANGRIWSCYTNENIPQNTSNWHLYIDKIINTHYSGKMLKFKNRRADRSIGA